MRMLLGNMLMCLIYVTNGFKLLMVYLHRQKNYIPATKNVSVKRSKTMLLQNKPNYSRFPLKFLNTSS
jgi:hypothetical protein